MKTNYFEKFILDLKVINRSDNNNNNNFAKMKKLKSEKISFFLLIFK